MCVCVCKRAASHNLPTILSYRYISLKVIRKVCVPLSLSLSLVFFFFFSNLDAVVGGVGGGGVDFDGFGFCYQLVLRSRKIAAHANVLKTLKIKENPQRISLSIVSS